MRLRLTCALLLCSSLYAQGISSSTARRVVKAASLPATCTVGDVYFKTAATVGIYQCLTANNWTAIAAVPSVTPIAGLFNLAGSALPNATTPNIKAQDSTTSGYVDVYTVPANRRVWWAAFYRYNPNTVSHYAAVKIDGSYYRVSATSTSAASIAAIGIFLEAGQSIAFNAATTSSLNFYGIGVEFDSTAKIKSGIVAGLATGDNTLYTCPSSYTAALLNAEGRIAAPGAESTGYVATALAGTPGNVSLYLTSGASASTNQLTTAASLAANVRSAVIASGIAVAGEKFILNVATGQTDSLAWVNIVETAQ